MLYQVGAYQDRDLYLKKSLKTVEEMESRILKILEVSRMERADRKAEIRKLELSKILRESYEPYEDLIEDKGLRLQVSLPDSFKVLGDPKLLKSALENILENAVKYSLREKRSGFLSGKNRRSGVLPACGGKYRGVDPKRKDSPAVSGFLPGRRIQK